MIRPGQKAGVPGKEWGVLWETQARTREEERGEPLQV